MKPVIGILGNLVWQQDPKFVSMERLYVNCTYANAIEKSGGVPILLQVTDDPEVLHRSLELCDGLLFPGGGDMHPTFFGEQPHEKLGVVIPRLDSFSIEVAKWADETGIPVLGICRGLQVLNVARGGSLYQDLSQRGSESYQHQQPQRRDNLMHAVHIEEGTCLRRILGTGEIYTNTLHHQSIKEVGQGLRVTAWADDGVIEGMESNDGKWVTVQWHPEELLLTEPRMKLLFEDLCARSTDWRNNRI